MEKHEKNPQQKLYEWLDTEQRFASLSDAILNRQGKEIPLPNPYAAPKKVAYWTAQNQVFMYRLEKKDLGESGGKHYLLEQFEAKNKSNSATARFKVEIYQDNVTPIEKLDSKNIPIDLDPLERKTAVHYAMSILTEAAKDDATAVLNQSIERRFPLVAAAYILSDLAVEKPGIYATIDRSSVILKSMDFQKQMLDMETYMTKLCVDREGDIDLDLFTHLASPPNPNLFNCYSEVDLRTALETVADEVESAWHNTITPSHHDFI